MREAWLWVLLLAGCGDKAGDSNAPLVGSGSTIPTGSTTSASNPWWEVDDVDGDGFSVAAGDCDDLDAAAHPDATDATCDGVDNDCDGVVDQDALTDESDPDLGDLTDVEETQLVQFLFPEGDEDRIRFYVEDQTFGWFDVEVWAYQVPPDVDVAIELFWVEDSDGVDRGRVALVDEFGPGQLEFLNHGGSVGPDDSGWYEAVIRATSGSSCHSPLQIQLAIGTL